MANPLIQIDDLVREMTDEEYASYLVQQKQLQAIEPPTAQKGTEAK
jgi:hypothetical protein